MAISVTVTDKENKMAEYSNGFHCTSLERHIVDKSILFLCKVKNERVTFEECGRDCPLDKALKKGTK